MQHVCTLNRKSCKVKSEYSSACCFCQIPHVPVFCCFAATELWALPTGAVVDTLASLYCGKQHKVPVWCFRMRICCRLVSAAPNETNQHSADIQPRWIHARLVHVSICVSWEHHRQLLLLKCKSTEGWRIQASLII